jgi:hypothetical protein
MSSAAPTTVFIPPTDLEYLTLKSEYSFDDRNLRNQFITVSGQINLDNMMFAKQHNLLLFREMYLDAVPFPTELFLYDQTPLQPQEGQAIKNVVPWTEKVADYDLATEFSKVYPGVPWISEYFAISSFPAIFGHFVSDEFLGHGLVFIESHIKDPLAPRLVGTFLLHCFLLRDRLLHIFFQMLAEREAGDLVEVFVLALSFSMPYFSHAHVRAVQALRGGGDERAIEAVFTHFLIEVVRVWQYHPFFATTGLIYRRTSSRATSFQQLVFEPVLLDELRKMASDHDRAVSVLDLFVVNVGMEMPKISSIILYGGIKYPVSVVDVVLLQHLHELFKALTGSPARPREVRGRPETAAVDAFRLRTRCVHYIQASVEEPVPTENSPHLTRKKLREHKAVHDFLFGLAGRLKHFHTIIAAQRNVLRLHYDAFAHRLFVNGPVPPQPAVFATVQRGGYALQVFDQFVRGVFQDYIRAHTEGVFADVLARELGLRITDGIANGQTIVEAILEGTVDYINDWKLRWNTDNPLAVQGPCSTDKSHDYPFCQFFADAVDQMTFALTMNHLSFCPFPILPGLLQQASQHWPFTECTKAEIDADDDIAALLPLYAEEKFLLIRAEQAAAAAFASGEIRWGSGNYIILFLQVEQLLRPLMATDLVLRISEEEPGWQRKLIAALFDGEDPTHFRTCLANCMMIVKMLKIEIRNPLLEDLTEIGNPITEEVIAAFENLRKWFDFKPEVSVFK